MNNFSKKIKTKTVKSNQAQNRMKNMVIFNEDNHITNGNTISQSKIESQTLSCDFISSGNKMISVNEIGEMKDVMIEPLTIDVTDRSIIHAAAPKKKAYSSVTVNVNIPEMKLTPYRIIYHADNGCESCLFHRVDEFDSTNLSAYYNWVYIYYDEKSGMNIIRFIKGYDITSPFIKKNRYGARYSPKSDFDIKAFEIVGMENGKEKLILSSKFNPFENNTEFVMTNF